MPKSKASRKPRRKPVTSKVKEGAARRVPPDLVDEAFLTEAEVRRRELFANAFVRDGLLSKAAAAAGYIGTAKTLCKQGHRLYNEPAVRARIERIQDSMLKEMQLDTRRVIAEMACAALLDPRRAFDSSGNILLPHELPEDVARAVAGYKVTEKTFGSGDDACTVVERELKFVSKEGMLEKVGKHLGMWKTDDQKSAAFTPEQFMQLLLQGRRRAADRSNAQSSSSPEGA